MTTLSTLTTNIYFYWIIIIVLLIFDIVLTIYSLKKRKRYKIKKEFLDVEEELKEQEEIKEEPVNEELEQIFKKMEEDSKLNPEEVVKKFEDDQEENAIISYQELVDKVKNNDVEIIEDDEGNIDFVEQLTKEMGIENIMEVEDEEISEPNEVSEQELRDTIDMISRKKIELDSTTSMDIIDELDNQSKFINSEAISPVFGRIKDNIQYDNLYNNTVFVEQVAGTTPKEELKKNEAFLQALIKFRNNL